MGTTPLFGTVEPLVTLAAPQSTFAEADESALGSAIRRVDRQRSATSEEIRGHTDTPHQDFGHSNSWV
jgi:hypothetical protein